MFMHMQMLRESAEACFGNEWSPSGKRHLHQVLVTRWRGRRGLAAPDQPWSVFTAGCMGVGKTHVMQVRGHPGPHAHPHAHPNPSPQP